MKQAFILFVCSFFGFQACFAGSSASLGPDGQTFAVSLTYDDSIPVHYEKVSPMLVKHGVRATFYLTVKFMGQPEKWKAVAAAGHELGNHSLFHPCRREPVENYSWVPAHYDLAYYDLARFKDELSVTNKFLSLLDGGKPRTYGNTCLNKSVGKGGGEVPIDPVVEELFVAARGNITNQVITKNNASFSALGHFNGDGRTFAQIRDEIKKSQVAGGWSIYMLHGVGKGTHPLYMAEDEHAKLVAWLSSQKDIWVAPVVDVAQRMKMLKKKQ